MVVISRISAWYLSSPDSTENQNEKIEFLLLTSRAHYKTLHYNCFHWLLLNQVFGHRYYNYQYFVDVYNLSNFKFTTTFPNRFISFVFIRVSRSVCKYSIRVSKFSVSIYIKYTIEICEQSKTVVGEFNFRSGNGTRASSHDVLN